MVFPVPQIHEELVDSVQIIPRAERIWCIFKAEEYREVVTVTPMEISPERALTTPPVPQVAEENLEVIKVTVGHVELAVSSGEAGSSCSGANSTTSDAATAAAPVGLQSFAP